MIENIGETGYLEPALKQKTNYDGEGLNNKIKTLILKIKRLKMVILGTNQ